jgi:hypothetical protein
VFFADSGEAHPGQGALTSQMILFQSLFREFVIPYWTTPETERTIASMITYSIIA